MEIYGRGAILDAAHGCRRNLNVSGLDALDLRTNKPDGSPWNFNKRSDRRLAYRMVKEQKPDWVLGSPPCTPFCTWNAGINKSKCDPAKMQASLSEGRAHLRFVLRLCG